jgi:hypothetical protein
MCYGKNNDSGPIASTACFTVAMAASDRHIEMHAAFCPCGGNVRKCRVRCSGVDSRMERTSAGGTFE